MRWVHRLGLIPFKSWREYPMTDRYFSKTATSCRVSLSVSLSLMTTGVVLLLWRNAYFKPGGSGFSSVRGDHGVSSSLSLLFVGVYRQACSRIPLAIGFVGRDRLLWNSIVQGTQRFRQVRAAILHNTLRPV